MKRGDDRPIGIFDSGIGGLTVLAAIEQALPAESTLYLGDTARVPYGTKSPAVVTRYATKIADFLIQRDIKALVVACNTASAVALPALQRRFDLPVLGVIAPGAERAVARSGGGTIGVIGTEGTVASGAYVQAIEAVQPGRQTAQRPCPLFVPLAEEGWGAHPVTVQVAEEYLSTWVRETGVDTLILGCTHYPLLVPAIEAAVGPDVRLIDSATAVARALADLLAEGGLARGAEAGPPQRRCFVTDVPDRFCRVGARFLGRSLTGVEQVDLEAGP